MGSQGSYEICEESELKNFKVYENYLTVYPVGNALTSKQKIALGMKESGN
jgi:hypothetical protein